MSKNNVAGYISPLERRSEEPRPRRLTRILPSTPMSYERLIARGRAVDSPDEDEFDSGRQLRVDNEQHRGT